MDRSVPLSSSHSFTQHINSHRHLCTETSHLHPHTNVTTDCATLIAKGSAGLKLTFMFQEQQPLISMYVLIDTCWVFPIWYEQWMEKMWCFDLIWAIVLLTVVWPWYRQRRKWFLPKHWTTASHHISGCFLFALFCFWSLSISHFFLSSIFWFLLSLCFISQRMFSEQLLRLPVKQNLLELMRKNIHLSLRLAGLGWTGHWNQRLRFIGPKLGSSSVNPRNKLCSCLKNSKSLLPVFICRSGLKTTVKKYY